jgi:hypothetical protein
MRLDMDVIEWLKREGRGYQTKANALLRREMLRSYHEKKAPGLVRRHSRPAGAQAARDR